MTSLIYAGWLLSATAMAQRFAAMGTAPTLSPRYYQAASPLRPLGKRQLASCGAGEHTCSDIGPLGAASCCPDDTYCIVDPTGSKAECCAIGSVCNSPCSESEYQCVITVTVTTVTPATTATSSACCPRQCTQTSMFGCASSLGGGCCSFGQTCASAGQCIWTSNPTSAAPSLVSQIPAGCTTSQIACPSSLGGGCCAVTQSCTFVGSGPHCAELTVAPTASGVAAVPQEDSGGGGMGPAAKAGIGVGVVVASGLVAGIAARVVLRRRKQRGISSQGSGPPDPGSDARTYTAAGTGVSSPRRPRPFARRTSLGILARDRRHPPEMTESPGAASHHGSGRLRGLTADYFGPAAVPGPFTEVPSGEEGGGGGGGGVGSLLPTPGATPPGGNNRDRAVPREPHGPDDIAAPVEIDSHARQRDVSDTIAGRFELYGSEVASPHSETTTSPQGDLVSPYTPSPGTAIEGTMLPSPAAPLGHGSNR